MLTDRWTKLKVHETQQSLWRSKARFCSVVAGRRSGKTEFAKRRIVRAACRFCAFMNGRFICAAPTRDQAKKIYWEDLKLLVPPHMMKGPASESELSITLWNGAKLEVVGMDVPARVEGPPLDGIILDEYADMKASAWGQHVRPALSTVGRPGWAWLIGVPNGRNHFYEQHRRASACTTGEWSAFHWISADILDPEEIRQAKHDLDPRSYRQEYEASFENFEGRVYYDFTEETHARRALPYNPDAELMVCFDFNVSPGVAAIVQDHFLDGIERTCVVGEVYIPDNSNTPAVCRKVIADWGNHRGKVTAFGDASGGARGTAKVSGNDWDLINDYLGSHFGDRFSTDVPRANPSERVRVNAFNSRIKSTDGTIRFFVDPRCKFTISDLEGVVSLEGGSGEIDKKYDAKLTHMSDGLGYFIVRRHPMAGGHVTTTEQY